MRYFHCIKISRNLVTLQSTKNNTKIAQYIASLMQKHGVVPDVIEVPPPQLIEVNYSKHAVVKLGNVLTPAQVKSEPIVNYTANNDDFFVLCMTDPDAPSRRNPRAREWHHWLMGNIPGSDISKGETLSGYIASSPLNGTGYHRYVFLLYKQPEYLKFDEKRLPNTSAEGRSGFSINKFAKKYNLGHPVAGNFFISQWDKSVPIIYQQLGFVAS